MEAFVPHSSQNCEKVKTKKQNSDFILADLNLHLAVLFFCWGLFYLTFYLMIARLGLYLTIHRIASLYSFYVTIVFSELHEKN